MKRADGPGPSNGQLVKKRKAGKDDSRTLTKSTNAQGALIHSVNRTSELKAPIMQLAGHAAEVYCSKFDPTGNSIASGSSDRAILLWNTYGDCDNYAQLNGSKGAVLDLQWSGDSRSLYSACADCEVSTWDVHSGLRLRRHTGHDDIVNSVDAYRRGTEVLVSGSDDATIGLWDPRQKGAIDHLSTQYSVTAVAFNSTGSQIFSGGLDNDIRIWDIRKMAVVETLVGHTDTITSLNLSPDGQTLLSNSMDNTLRLWNVQPFAPEERNISTLEGAIHGNERNLLKAAWSNNGARIAAGSGDRSVMVWDVRTAKILYKLPGHKGTVNSVDMHPKEPIVLSGSVDKTIFLGEIAFSVLSLCDVHYNKSTVSHMSSEADQMMAKADKKATSSGGMSSWFSGGMTSKYEEAAELYSGAANQYRLAKRNRDAGAAFEKAAAMQLKTDEADDAANTYVEASKCYRKEDPSKCVQVLELAVDRFTKRGNFRRGANYRQQVAEIYELDLMDAPKAMEAYESAAEWLASDNAESQANKLYLKVAEIAGLEGDYQRACDKFEQVATTSVHNGLTKWSVKEYYLKAGICHLCKNDIVAVKRAIEHYATEDMTFTSTKEYQLLNELADALENGDSEEFTNYIYVYDQVMKLDKWKTTMLLRIKNQMNEEPDLT
ncbi:Putative uncharacterized protein [Taphrina deformans PYCC 5710]|uniref:Uncharacterized protein n=1 Tax=Taphrina deformans (strain PYCC 5710 / ATCC 11124 / CBS 356.35 / IMI 108563 / JCM 9778 / NBRC 8474) TaxID=1097556 RepID=R4XBY3_TAPDE|nr:Putative uncharacterized protein [Taphrina deformans PYCC 5710]|eukprot:CCG83382.1 Putative uncharacterized protein [Taphrina deformans PYCC 5710]